jgi:type II secretory pathway pseudopilin PulG
MMRVRDESGLTLIELLVAMVVSFIVFAATLAVFESMVRQEKQIEDQTEVETMARHSVDRLARQLRNLASPADIVTNIAASTQPKSIDRNLPTDLIFKDVGDTQPVGSLNSANVRRVRYCLQSSGPVADAGFSASPSRQVLWMQIQSWTSAAPPAAPTTTDCPGTGWAMQRIVADRIVNTAATPLFGYSGDAGVISGSTDQEREQIARVTAAVQVDPDTSRPPAATQITTGVILRNQNRAPVADFEYTLLNPVTCSIQLNGSASEDPESKPLQYEWFIDGVPQNETGVVVQTSVSAGPHTYLLRVFDRARLVGSSSEETRTC